MIIGDVRPKLKFWDEPSPRVVVSQQKLVGHCHGSHNSRTLHGIARSVTRKDGEALKLEQIVCEVLYFSQGGRYHGNITRHDGFC